MYLTIRKQISEMKLKYNDDLTRNQLFAVVLCFCSQWTILFLFFEPVYVNMRFIYDSINSTWLQKVMKCQVLLEYLYSIIASGTLLNHIIFTEKN